MRKTTTYPGTCPYYSECDSICLASISCMFVSGINALLRCKSEDHDNCPVFLSKVLRSA